MTFALFILFVALSYINPGEIVPALAPYRVTFWIGLAGLAAAIVSLLWRGRGPVATLQLWILIVFTAVMALSLTIAESWLGAPVHVLQRLGPSLTVFVLATSGVTSLVRLRIAAGCIVALTLLLLVQGAAAYHFGYNAELYLLDRSAEGDEAAGDTVEDEVDSGPVDRFWAGVASDDESWEPPRIRALGFMRDPNDLAVGMVVALGLIAGAWRPRLQLRGLIPGAAAAALIYGIYLTRSRGGAVALVVVLWRFAAGRIGRGPALIVLVALGAGMVAVDFGGRSLTTELDESASGRLVAWKEGFEMLKTEPILGVGYGQFLERHTLTAHNSLVLCFAETGLLGCFFWVGLLVVTLLELREVKTLPAGESFDTTAGRWAEGLQLSLIGFLTAAFFLSRTFVPTLYLIVGLSAAVAAIARDAGRPVSLPALPALGMLVLGCELAGIGVIYAIVRLHAV